MAVLLKIIGGGWAILGAANIIMSPSLSSGNETGLVAVLMFNVILFVLPGLVVYGIGAAITKKPEPVKEKALMMQCPYCAETIKAQAKVCRFCNKDIPESERKPAPPTEDIDVNSLKYFWEEMTGKRK